jgi:poly(beta-D-mannuronate) lyase
MKLFSLKITVLIFFSSFFAIAQPIMVSTIDEFNLAMKKVSSGGTVILKNGEWRDVMINAHGNGTKQSPVIVKAETPGKVLITGDSSLNIYGTYVIVSGLWFKDGKTTKKHVVQFRKNSTVFAYNCRFTNSTISYFDTVNDISNHWVDLYGKNNRVDHNNFTGKESTGTTLVVVLREKEHQENNHRIDHNYFGFRPELGENGGETIRIGTSTFSRSSSKTLVENNIFRACNGESEIISNKSGDNIYRNNLFIESEGTLTLRHGNNAIVENNVFVGNGKPKTGGIRVINAGHVVQNNLMIGLKGTGYRAPIVVMNGVPNSPLNRYDQVKDVIIQNNTIIDCSPIVFGAGKSAELSLPAISSVFTNNLFLNNKGAEIAEYFDTVDGIEFSGNIVDTNATVDNRFFTKSSVDWSYDTSVPIPTENNEVLNVEKNIKSPIRDILNMERSNHAVGAFNLGSSKIPKALKLRAGPGWKPNIKIRVKKPDIIDVYPGPGNLRIAIGKATSGSTIRLAGATYEIEKSIKVEKEITIEGAADGSTMLKSMEDLENPFMYFFKVSPGGKLIMKNLTLDALDQNSIKYALVSPSENESGLYSIYADNCIFQNFKTKKGGSIFKAYIGTKADTLSFSNTRFENSYRGLNLSYDKYNIGKYNANVIMLKNTVFKNIEEHAVNYYRETLDANLPGGELIIDHCVFDNVYNNEKGKILIAAGINKVNITNSVFVNSYKIQIPMQLSGATNIMDNCLFYDVGFPKFIKGAIDTNVLYKKPKWLDENSYIPNEKSPLLKEKNGVGNMGLIY